MADGGASSLALQIKLLEEGARLFNAAVAIISGHLRAANACGGSFNDRGRPATQ